MANDVYCSSGSRIGIKSYGAQGGIEPPTLRFSVTHTPSAKSLASRNLRRVRIETLIISSISVDIPRQRTHTRGHWGELIVRTQRGHEHEISKP
jgi:hypothetical protein